MSTITPNYTYIYYDVVDYTNSNVLSSYTLSNTPLTFIPDFTTSSVLSGATNISNKTLHWDFGDGSASTELNPTHHYQWPGIYNVTLTIFDGFGNAYDSTYSATVQIFNYISTQIAFQDYKSLIYDIPVGKLIDPLTINTYFSWQDYPALSAMGYTINLYASGAHGAYNYIPQTRLDKWTHLRTLSRFYTLSTINGNPDYVTIESIQPTVTEIYVNIQNNQLQRCNATDFGSVLTGVTGSCQFWYTDDIPTNLLTESSPIIIFASIDNSKFNDAFTYRVNAFDYISYPPQGFQNIDPAVFASVKTRYNPADHLSITTTGIDGEGTPVDHTFDIPPISWQDTEIPYVIKFKDSEDFTTKNYPPLSSSVVQNPSITPQQFYDVQTGIVNVSGNLYVPLDGVTFYEDFSSQVPQSIGAFYKGYFTVSQSTENCILTASINVKDQPYYLKDALINWITIPQYNSAIRVLRQENIDGYNNFTTITFSNSAKFNINANNVYALAVAPSGAGADNDYQTWFADPVGDQILKYDIYGNLLTTYQLSAMVTLVNNQTSIVDYRYPFTPNSLSAASPNDLTLDRKNNLWASLIDSGVVIKLDTASGLVTTIAAPTTATNVTTLSSDYNSLSGFAGEDLYLPSSIDTDINNNLWVAYTHPDYSALIKYQGENNFTTNAVVLTSIIFPSGVSPEQIQIDRNSNIWVTAINHNSQGIGFSNRNDYLYKFDISGNLISGFPLTGFQQIGNLAIDGNQNAWVIQGAETLTKIDGVTNQTTNYIAGLGNNTTNYICSIGGITCDTSNDIWVINNFDKTLYVFDANLIATDVLNPKYTLPLTYPTTGLPAISSYTTPINVANNQYGYSDGLKEFQAYGDWNGYNWLNKYAAPVSTIRTITGASNLFNIYPSTGQYNIAKVNENWNASGFYDSLRYQETLLDKQVFFDQFLGVIVGGLDAQPYELGKTVYEKIANFVNNNADISKANINELISFCQELTVEFDQYNLTLPPQLRRLVDLLSIKQSTLWGNNNKFTQNFNTQGTIISNSTYGVNLGLQIDPLTGVFTNGTSIVAQELFSDNFKLINNNLITYYATGDVVPLSSYTPDWGWGLVAPDTVTGTQISNFYKFYNYNPVFNNTYYDNVINWNDPYTTLSPSNSSYSNWSSDNGIVQSLLSYELTMGLRLFTSAANITYNS
jgi:streptogramin lyase